MPSELIKPIKHGIVAKLKDPERRRKMFRRMAQDEIAMQLRHLRERRGFRTQSAFAAHAGMQQSAISRIENADYQGWSFKTLFRVADKLDVRLRIIFEPAEDVQRRFEIAQADADELLIDTPTSTGQQALSAIESEDETRHLKVQAWLEAENSAGDIQWADGDQTGTLVSVLEGNG